jgi:uncharacterized RDD family membrane protein YckC
MGVGNKFCYNCGAQADPVAAVCIKCGVALYGAPGGIPAAPPAGYPGAAPGGYPGAPRAGFPTPLAAPAYMPPMAMDFAPWATRVGGYLIDGVLIGVGMLVVWFVAGGLLAAIAGLGGQAGASAAGGTCCLMIILFPVATLLVGLYNRVYLISQRGYSIGQGIVKVKVVDASGRLLSMGTAFVRLLAQAGMGFVPFLPLLDLLWPLWDERRQTLHDKAVGCYVINQPQ